MKYFSKDYIISSLSLLVFCAVGVFILKIKWFIYAGPILLLILLIPSTGRPVTYFWNEIAKGLAQLINKLLLFIVFFLLLTPLALLRRLRNYIYRDKNHWKSQSFYDKNEVHYKIEDLRNMW